MDQHLLELGRKVVDARMRRGWSKEQAAREAGISSITWKRVEDGLSVQDVKRASVLRVLGLDYRGDPVGSTQDDPLMEAIMADSRLSASEKRQLAAVVAEVRRNSPQPPPQADAPSESA